MKHFNAPASLADLKKQYRELALRHHPDRGGDTATMQEINQEFARLYAAWVIRGGDTDEEAVTAEQYTHRFWQEYAWMGENFRATRSHDKHMIFDKVREFLKATYPSYSFSVRKLSWNSWKVSLMSADFYPYKDHDRLKGCINEYSVDRNAEITDRCREVMMNIIRYVNSWNYDNSDLMTDYFDVNFYVDFEIGRSGKSFTYKPKMIGEKPREYRRRTGPVMRSVKEAMGGGNAFLHPKEYDREAGRHVIREDLPKVLCKDDENHYPLWYSQPSLVRARIAKLAAVGVEARVTRRGIELVGYSEALAKALADEEAAEDARERAFYAKKGKGSDTTEEATEKAPDAGAARDGVRIVDYSEKAIAVIGDTLPVKDMLRRLGGRYNARLACGPGWVFSKRREQEVRSALAAA